MGKMGKAFLTVLVLAALAWAGDVWNEKPYLQWDQKETIKVLNDSPWAKETVVNATWRSAATSSSEVGGEGAGDIGYGRPSPMSSGQGGAESGAQAASTYFKARWLSSRTIREGLVRFEILSGKKTEADAERYLAQEPAEYQILIFGPDMSPFSKVEENDLNQNAYLEMKKAKLKLMPDQVQIQRDQEGKRVISVVFFFPKKAPDGTPTIPSNEKGIEFACRLGKSMLKFSFYPEKMVDKQGRDL